MRRHRAICRRSSCSLFSNCTFRERGKRSAWPASRSFGDSARWVVNRTNEDCDKGARPVGIGDEHAFLTLYRRHHGEVYRFSDSRKIRAVEASFQFLLLRYGCNSVVRYSARKREDARRFATILFFHLFALRRDRQSAGTHKRSNESARRFQRSAGETRG
jgi:hypothetical protein